MSLREFLSSLNSSESNYGIWVDPDNFDNYRVGSLLHENGGVLDNFLFIGSLDRLSFGNQSEQEAFWYYLRERLDLVYERFKSSVFFEHLYKDYLEGNLPNQEEVESEVQDIMKTWAEEEIDAFLEEVENNLEETLCGS